ncbi:MAG: TetR/AcrR family transcriptional regulator [Streptosporangiaceae bacterium]
MDPEDEELWEIFDRSHLGRDRREHRVHERMKQMQDRGRQAPRRGRSLSRDEIVTAAIKVADAEGSAAINMRRIARELNAGAMSLYWHVSSKDELLDMMLDAVEGGQQFPEATGDWRADLHAAAWIQRTALHQHQWLMDFIGGRPPLGPNTLRNLERSLAVIDNLGLDTFTALNVLAAVGTYVMGAVLREFRETAVERRDQEAAAGLSGSEFSEIVEGHVQRLKANGRFPRFLRMYEEGIDPDSPETRDERFEFGLQCVLDGIAARLAAQTDPQPG